MADKRYTFRGKAVPLFRIGGTPVAEYSVPLYLSSIMGIIMCGVSFVALLFILIRAMIYGDPVAGWPSLVCIITLLGGLVLLALGIMGLYIAKIYLETKKRQIFIVREEK